jgi:DNA end-binding protein Ku
MARSSWSGFLGFGLVNVPVSLFSATEDQTIHFNQVHRGTSHRVRYKKVDEQTGAELSQDDIVNGFALGGGEYVIVTPEELQDAAPGKSELIEIVDFVDLDSIDPIFYRQSYYVAPKGKGADRAYALLLQAMRETKKIGVATMVMRDKEHLVAVRPGSEVMILETMYFEDEIRDPREELDTLPSQRAATARELAVASQLIEALSHDWDPSRYKNTYRGRVEELIEKKRAGHAIVVSDEAERPRSNVVDLMSALQASVARTGGGARRGGKTTSRLRRPEIVDSPASLNALTKTELLDSVRESGHSANAKMTKAELVKALQESPSAKRRKRRAS